MSFDTLAAELLYNNSTHLRYTTFSITTQYADSAHLTAVEGQFYCPLVWMELVAEMHHFMSIWMEISLHKLLFF